ncbi:MAG: GNAT family N-acetyltransferase [Dehalococcoidales bacterium]|nr:MAG: GNAT family N-acetyltransferase [Dehalococcoidales bacterium]
MDVILATDSHVPEIIDLWKEFMDFHKDIDPRFPIRGDAPLEWKKHLRGLMQSENVLILVAIDENQMVGFSISLINRYTPIWKREFYGAIDSIAVKSEYRRQGIGEQLLVKIFEWFESLKIDRIEVSVAARNQVGYSFWKKHGFQDYTHRLYLDRR